jgi:hypothetical protein
MNWDSEPLRSVRDPTSMSVGRTRGKCGLPPRPRHGCGYREYPLSMRVLSAWGSGPRRRSSTATGSPRASRAKQDMAGLQRGCHLQRGCLEKRGSTVNHAYELRHSSSGRHTGGGQLPRRQGSVRSPGIPSDLGAVSGLQPSPPSRCGIRGAMVNVAVPPVAFLRCVFSLEADTHDYHARRKVCTATNAVLEAKAQTRRPTDASRREARITHSAPPGTASAIEEAVASCGVVLGEG